MVSLTILMISLCTTLGVQKVEASGTIYIRADGSIDPPTAPISTSDNVTYILTGNITSDYEGILIQRDNVILDGLGYWIQYVGKPFPQVESSVGIKVADIGNVTIQNFHIDGFSFGIYLSGSNNDRIYNNTLTNTGIHIFYSFQNEVQGNTVNGKPLVYLENAKNQIVSNGGQVILIDCFNIVVENLDLSNASEAILLLYTNNSTIANCTIEDNLEGITLWECKNTLIFRNNITGNGMYSNYGGIALSGSPNSTVDQNNITLNGYGIVYLDGSIVTGNVIANNTTTGISYCESNNVITGNTMANNTLLDIMLLGSNNQIYYNNFAGRSFRIQSSGLKNTWDDGYKGNYWGNYNGTDANHDDIGDTPYVIDENNTDHYPLMTQYIIPEFPSFLILPLFFIATLLAVMVCKRRHALNA
jgi:parallel beta-helix repeat protein